jgi:hypothetical protein
MKRFVLCSVESKYLTLKAIELSFIPPFYAVQWRHRIELSLI